MRTDGFHRLLERLDADPAEAARAYHGLRRALLRFFEARGAPFPDDGADEALDRLAGKLGGGAAVTDVSGFALGIARHVHHESIRRASRIGSLGDADPVAPPSEPQDDGALAERLDACLTGMTAAERELVLSYYAGGHGRAKIEARRAIALKLGLTDNALRSRVQRLRDRLERELRASSTHLSPVGHFG